MSGEKVATHARIIRLKNEPGKADEVIKQWTSEILPLVKKQQGFRGVSLLR